MVPTYPAPRQLSRGLLSGAGLEGRVARPHEAGLAEAEVFVLAVLLGESVAEREPPVQFGDGLGAGVAHGGFSVWRDAVEEAAARPLLEDDVAVVEPEQYPNVGTLPGGLCYVEFSAGVECVGQVKVIMYARRVKVELHFAVLRCQLGREEQHQGGKDAFHGKIF